MTMCSPNGTNCHQDYGPEYTIVKVYFSSLLYFGFSEEDAYPVTFRAYWIFTTVTNIIVLVFFHFEKLTCFKWDSLVNDVFGISSCTMNLAIYGVFELMYAIYLTSFHMTAFVIKNFNRLNKLTFRKNPWCFWLNGKIIYVI